MQSTDNQTPSENASVAKKILVDSIAGVTKLDNPIIGYKKIGCDCSNMFTRFFVNPTTKKAIATMTIPAGSTVVRPVDGMRYSTNENDTVKQVQLGKKYLRTDEVIVTDIEFESPVTNKLFHLFNHCKCSSLYYGSMDYKMGESHKPLRPLDTDIEDPCESGIHFMLKKEHTKTW